MSNIKKILVPYDDNLRSIGAIEYASMFASGIGAKITALHLADPKDYRSVTDFKVKIREWAEEQLRPKLRQIQQDYPDIHKIDLQIRGLEKPLHRHILDFADENETDFIVLRSHGLPNSSDWELFLSDTNAYKVVLESTCPVFTFTKVPSNPRLKDILVPLDLSEGSLYKVPLAIELGKQFGATLHLLSASEHKEDIEDLKQQLEEIQHEVEKIGVHCENLGVYPDALPIGFSRNEVACENKIRCPRGRN